MNPLEMARLTQLNGEIIDIDPEIGKVVPELLGWENGTLPFIFGGLVLARTADRAETQGAIGDRLQLVNERFRPAGQALVDVATQHRQLLGLVAFGEPGRPVGDGREQVALGLGLRQQQVGAPAGMGGGAGPGVGLRPADHAGADRVPLHVAQRRPQIRLVERRGEEPALPHVPMPAAPAIDPLRIAHVQRLEHTVQAVFAVGHRDQVDMVGHQAVAEDGHAVLAAIGLEPGEIGAAVVVGKEDVLPAVAALGDVVRYPGKDGARQSGHAGMLAESA